MVYFDDLISLELYFAYSLDLILNISQFLLLNSNPLDERCERVLGNKGVLNL